jgi:hypothetical protein
MLWIVSYTHRSHFERAFIWHKTQFYIIFSLSCIPLEKYYFLPCKLFSPCRENVNFFLSTSLAVLKKGFFYLCLYWYGVWTCLYYGLKNELVCSSSHPIPRCWTLRNQFQQFRNSSTLIPSRAPEFLLIPQLHKNGITRNSLEFRNYKM